MEIVKTSYLIRQFVELLIWQLQELLLALFQLELPTLNGNNKKLHIHAFCCHLFMFGFLLKYILYVINTVDPILIPSVMLYHIKKVYNLCVKSSVSQF